MRPETALETALAHRLRPGNGRYPVLLDNAILDRFGRSALPPHVCGFIERRPSGEVVSRLLQETRAGRDAFALLGAGLLDITFDGRCVRLVP
jgi:hypothetical protein